MVDYDTRVALVHESDQRTVWLRFGTPKDVVTIDPQRRRASFSPGSVFCRVFWEANDYGTTRWELSIVRAPSPREPYQQIAGIDAGGVLLLHVQHAKKVQSLLRLIDAIESTGVDPGAVAESYWRMVHQRVAAQVVVPPLTPERHHASALRRDVL